MGESSTVVTPFTLETDMTDRTIDFVDSEGNVYSVHYIKSFNLWNTRVNDFGGGEIQPAHNGDVCNRIEFFNSEQDLLHFFNSYPLTRVYA